MIGNKNFVALVILALLCSLNFADILWKVQIVDLQNLARQEYVLGDDEFSLEFLKERGYDCSISKTMDFSQQKMRGKSLVCLQGGTTMATAVMCSPTEPDSQHLVFVLGKKVVQYSLRLECQSR